MISLSNGFSVKVAQGLPTWQSSSSRCRTWWWRWTDGDVGPSTAQTLSNWMNGGMNEWLTEWITHETQFKLRINLKEINPIFGKKKTMAVISIILYVTSNGIILLRTKCIHNNKHATISPLEPRDEAFWTHLPEKYNDTGDVFAGLGGYEWGGE